LERWSLKGDPIIQIGVTSHKYGETSASMKCIFVLGTCEITCDDIEVHAFDDEASLIVAWARYMKLIDPEIVVGYNIFGFDFEYIHARACVLRVDDVLSSLLTRLPDHPSKLVVREMSSSALGDNVLKYLDMPGRILIDLMKVVQRDHRLDSYKLDAVARHFTGEAKDDISPKDIFRLQKGSAEDRGVIAKYCIQDCALCNLLVAKLEIIANNSGMANVCWVPLSHIFMRGQGIKIFSLVAKQCHDDGFVIPTRRINVEGPNGKDEGYEGAIVLEPKTGMYLDEPVSVLDYNSLYPSSMIAENISHDTLVTMDSMSSIPGVEYVDIYPFGASGQVCRFAQSPKGILPRILEMLLQQRKDTRARIPATKDMFQRAVLEGLQLAYKTTANSLYGQMGARTSPLYLREIAASTTATGRSMILLAKDYIEKEFNGNVVYGDSVPGYTPVIMRIAQKFVVIQTVDDIAQRYEWKECLISPGKESIELNGMEIWSDMGWTPAFRLIRHRLDPHKKMMRVATNSGVVDVTDDHSLLRVDGITPVTPKDLKCGDHILHFDNYPMSPIITDLCSDTVYALAKMRAMGPVPMVILSTSYHARLLYWTYIVRPIILCSSQLASATVYILGCSLGLSKNMHVFPTGLAVSVGVLEAQRTVTSIIPLSERPEYVYDFTTHNHKFAAGVGSIVVHNTDSLFVVFPPPPSVPVNSESGSTLRLAHSISCGQNVSNGIYPLLKKPHYLEYEKTFFPLILLSKKRYVGLLYEDDPYVKPKQKSMGIALKRRDYAPIVKRVYGGVIDVVLTRRDIPAAVEYLRGALKELALGNTPIEELVISKTLKAYYKFPEQIAHSVLARRMFARDPGSAPQVNDRIPYVFVETSKKDALMGDRIEHVDYVRTHSSSVRIDAKTYIESQLTKPCIQLLAIALESIPGYNAHASKLPSFSELVIQKDGDEIKARTRLSDLREREVNKLIFDPILALPVFRARNNRCKGQQEITNFFKRV
jgi:DNA polymerase elongation subunit (family B)